MKFIRQQVSDKGIVTDFYWKTWRHHKIIVAFEYELSCDAHWDGDEPIPDHYECYDILVKARFQGHEGTASLCNSWIDPRTEGRRGSNYLYTVACDLLEEAIHEMGKKLIQSGHVCKNKLCIVESVHES